MKRYILIFTILFSVVFSSHSQRWKLKRYEAYFGVGSAQVFGDIGGTASESNLFGLKDIQLDETRPAFSVGLRYKLDPYYSVKLNYTFGLAHADDADARNSERDFAYKSAILEQSAQIEYYFIRETRQRRSSAMYNRRGMINDYNVISLYGFTGLGSTFFWAKFEGTDRGDVDEINESKFITLSVPLGMGIKMVISDKWIVGAEIGGRWTASDFLDAYTQTQSSKSNDIYYFTIFSAAYRIKTSRRGLPIFLDRYYLR